MSNEHINPDTLPNMAAIFSQVVTSTGSKTIHISGQVAFDEEMNVVGKGDYMAQAVKVFQNLAMALEAAGASPQDLVSNVVYVKDLNQKAMEDITKAQMIALDGKPFPPSTCTMIGVTSLVSPDLLVEISATAVV